MQDKVYWAGEEYKEEGDDHKSYTISRDGHCEQIIVYGDSALRDRIVRLLNEDEAKHDRAEERQLVDDVGRTFPVLGSLMESHDRIHGGGAVGKGPMTLIAEILECIIDKTEELENHSHTVV